MHRRAAEQSDSVTPLSLDSLNQFTDKDVIMARAPFVTKTVYALVTLSFAFAAASVRGQQPFAAPPEPPPSEVRSLPPAGDRPTWEEDYKRRLEQLQKQLDELRAQQAIMATAPQPAVPNRGPNLQGTHRERTFSQGLHPNSLNNAPGLAAQAAAANPTPIEVPSFISVTDYQLYARAAMAFDTTRLDPAAMGLFLPSAIPVTHDPFFGTNSRTTFIGNNTSAGIGWTAQIPDQPAINGYVQFRAAGLTSDENGSLLADAWIQWNRLIFGVMQYSAFTDQECLLDTVDLAGPNAAPWFYKNIVQFNYLFLSPEDVSTDPTGFYAVVSAEGPQTDVGLPPGAGWDAYTPIPDFVGTLTFKSGDYVTDNCTAAKIFREFWHIQCGTLIRDLAVDRSNGVGRTFDAETTGWGVQLSSKVLTRFDPCNELYDYAVFSVVGGDGIGRYFNDLNLINPVNDAFLDTVTGKLEALPVVGVFAGYQHDWTPNWRSTIMFSHLEIDRNNVVFEGTAPLPTYREGNYASANLTYRLGVCSDNKPDSKNTKHILEAGAEYLYGEHETLAGNIGHDQRALLFVSASK